jgi:hypothetical protein|tara:strand:- start:1371 stop:1517 length:147 start_codon:yes stop_codon:yes gene_type:complete
MVLDTACCHQHGNITTNGVLHLFGPHVGEKRNDDGPLAATTGTPISNW